MDRLPIRVVFLCAGLVACSGFSGIPFNIPNTRFCAPCNAENVVFSIPTYINSLDLMCYNFLRDSLNNHTDTTENLLILLNTMKDVSPQNAWILQAYINAKYLYERLYNQTYTYFVAAMQSGSSENCLHVFEGGVGVPKTRKNVLRRSITDIPRTKTSLIAEKWENIFFEGVRDLWTTVYCQAHDHYFYRLAAIKRFVMYQGQAVHWVTNSNEGRSFDHTTASNTVALSQCGNPFPFTLSDCTALVCADNPGAGQKSSSSEQEQQRPSNLPLQPVQPLATSIEASISVLKSDKEINLDDEEYLVINEVSPCKPGKFDEFLELRMEPSTSVRYFGMVKVVAISANSFKILAVASLYKKQIPVDGYFLLLPGDQITTADDYDLFDVLPCAESEPIIVAVLQNNDFVEKRHWDSIALRKWKGKSYRSVRLSKEETPATLSAIRDTMVDALVYGKQQNSPISSLAKDILPYAAKSCNFILSTGDPSNENQLGQSLNLCPNTNTKTFQYKQYKLGYPTPGSPNSCIDSIKPLIEQMEHGEVDESKYTVGVTDSPSNEDECPVKLSRSDVIRAKTKKEIEYIKQHVDANYVPPDITTSDFANKGWLDMIDNGFQRLHELKTILPYEVVYPSEEDSTFPKHAEFIRCKICYERFTECPHTVSKTQRNMPLASKEGKQLSTSLSKNKILLISHLSTDAHLLSVLYSVQMDVRHKCAQKRERYVTDKKEDILTLANIFDVTYTFVRTNTAPQSAPIWFKTLKKMGASVGTTLHTRDAAFAIINFIAEEAMSTLFAHLVRTNPPCMLILDGSSDTSNKHYVMVYIQALEGELTMPYFIGNMELKQRFDSEAYLDALLEMFKALSESFFVYFKNNVVAIATDSAAVMQKFHERLNEVIKRTVNGKSVNLISIFCLAHRLQLATRSALMPLKRDKDLGVNNCLDYFENVEKFLQNTYVFFKSSGKRIGAFRQMVVEGDEKVVSLQQLYLNRWISSEWRTVRNFLASWVRSERTLTTLIESNELNKDNLREAQGLLLKFHDKNMIIIVHFLQDFTAVFKVWSEYLQRFTGLLIEQYKYYSDMFDNIEVLEEYRSDSISKFLSECYCTPNVQGCTLEEYEAAKEVTWKSIHFSTTINDGFALTDLVPDLIRKVKARINVYFKEELIRSAAVLNPANLPPGIESLYLNYPLYKDTNLRIYGYDEVKYLANMIGMNVEELLTDWAILIEALLKSSSWLSIRKITDANIFWATALRENMLPWTDNTRQFVRIMKIIAPGSTICESGFSIFNVIKSQRRATLSDEHLQNALRIVINGPADIDLFDSFRYAERYKLSKYPVTPDEPKHFSKTGCDTETDPDLVEEINVSDEDIFNNEDEEENDYTDDTDDSSATLEPAIAAEEDKNRENYVDIYDKLVQSTDYKDLVEKKRHRSVLI